MGSYFPTAVYVLCFLTSSACAFLLGRAYWRTSARILLWSALCFMFLAANNFVVIFDMVVYPDVDFRFWRHLFALSARVGASVRLCVGPAGVAAMLSNFSSGAIAMGFLVSGLFVPALLEDHARLAVPLVRRCFRAPRHRPGHAHVHRCASGGAQPALPDSPLRFPAHHRRDLAEEPPGGAGLIETSRPSAGE